MELLAKTFCPLYYRGSVDTGGVAEHQWADCWQMFVLHTGPKLTERNGKVCWWQVMHKQGTVTNSRRIGTGWWIMQASQVVHFSAARFNLSGVLPHRLLSTGPIITRASYILLKWMHAHKFQRSPIHSCHFITCLTLQTSKGPVRF